MYTNGWWKPVWDLPVVALGSLSPFFSEHNLVIWPKALLFKTIEKNEDNIIINLILLAMLNEKTFAKCVEYAILSRVNVSRSKSILLTLHPSQPQQARRPVAQVGRSPLKFLPHRKLEFAIDFTIFYIFGRLKKFSPPLEPILHPSVPCLTMGLSHSFASYIITRPTF